jgi:hypothetical protein
MWAARRDTPDVDPTDRSISSAHCVDTTQARTQARMRLRIASHDDRRDDGTTLATFPTRFADSP